MGEKYLILENGTVFKGLSFGYDGETVGELVFSTGMEGYIKTIADSEYFGQIVLQTFPLIGNYGVIPEEFGPGPIHLKAYIVRQWCQEPSNFKSEGNLDSFLRDNKTPGLWDIDTRAVTRIIRENGVMNAMISNTPELNGEQWALLRGYKVTGAVAACSLPAQDTEPVNSEHGLRVAVWDFGSAGVLTQGLAECGYGVTVLGYGATAEEILCNAPNGLALSGGPGDPLENTGIIGEISKLLDKGIPIFGVGLGHQMLALARGAKTVKLPFGHRGSNQTVTELETGRMFVTTQNHGYAVIPGSLPQSAQMDYINSNDGTCEGITYTDIPAFSVQFAPDDDQLNKFAMLMRRKQNAAE